MERKQVPKNYTYTEAGVNRSKRAESKKELKTLFETYKQSYFGDVLRLPYGNVFPIGANTFLDLVIEGVGTKVLMAQLAEKYDTIGIDAVAMAVNDVIRSGAKPLAIADNIHAKASDPALVKAWLQGIAKGAIESECPVTGGEIGDVAEIINGIRENVGFDLVVSSIGQVRRKDVITGENIKVGDPIVGLASSGVHSNGITLVRKILFKQWGGKYEPTDVPQGLERQVALEVLEPTRIYVKELLALAREVKIKAAVHITGDAYNKFLNLSNYSPGIGFEFSNFKPQPVFGLIQRTAEELGYNISDEEMFKTFNMGWGFAVIVDKKDTEKAVNTLEEVHAAPEIIGKITKTGKVEVHFNNKKMILT